jgi:uncharacterized integral membrane protein
VGIIIFALVLLVLLIFILQNTRSVEVSYFGAHGHLPLAVAMLLSAVGGVLLAATAGSLRIGSCAETPASSPARPPCAPMVNPRA